MVIAYPVTLAKQTKLLGHPLRLEILRILITRREACCVNQLIDILTEAGIAPSQPTISHCLKDLTAVGLVAQRSHVGSQRFYAAVPSALVDLLGNLGSYTGITQANSVQYAELGEEVKV